MYSKNDCRPQIEVDYCVACYIHPKVMAKLAPYLSYFPLVDAFQVPSGLSTCSYGWCKKCKCTLKKYIRETNQEYDDPYSYTLKTLDLKNFCDCMKKPDADYAKIAKDHYFCQAPAVYHSYFNINNLDGLPNLEAYCKYLSENNACDCYWPDTSSMACEISNLVFEKLDWIWERYWPWANLFDFFGRDYITRKWFSERSRFRYMSFIDYRTDIAHAQTVQNFFYSDYLQTLDSFFEQADDYASWFDEDEFDCWEFFRDLQDIKKKIQEKFIVLYGECIKKHPHPKPYYERAMIQFHHGKWAESLGDLEKFIEMAEKYDLKELLTSDLYLCQGMVYIEGNRFDLAFESLTQAIAKDPKNKQAYFERALIQFELGDYEAAVEDYLASSMVALERRSKQAKVLFTQALGEGLRTGTKQAIYECVPNLLSGIRGIGEGIWAFALDPVGTTDGMALFVSEALVDCFEFFRKNVTKENYDRMADELQHLYDDWDNLDHRDLGYRMGHVVGFYGTDIIMTSGAIKGVALYKEYKRVSAIYTLEKCAKDRLVLERVTLAAEERATAHQTLLRAYGDKLKIEPDKQGKHLVGHNNYVAHRNRSIFTHSDPDRLLREHAGTGIKCRKKLGEPGYKEYVNFQENIGFHVDQNTGILTSTTWGDIHYSKNGAHIVPVLGPDLRNKI